LISERRSFKPWQPGQTVQVEDSKTLGLKILGSALPNVSKVISGRGGAGQSPGLQRSGRSGTQLGNSLTRLQDEGMTEYIAANEEGDDNEVAGSHYGVTVHAIPGLSKVSISICFHGP
jgi:hypothetical protein